MYWNGHGMGGWGWFAMSFGSVLLILLIIAIVFLVLHGAGGSGHGAVGRPDPPAPSAEQLLAERFALGEIDDEEYERRLAGLRRHRPGRAGR
ncbi:SHOCT domain-containing protein [Streptomyces yangpuensis]|uniref:SHOCT domain-containing protein n=1 Tax=Streptomyces yangpuensis TaxID=1648182 RepID=UPI0037F1901C